MSPSNTLLRPIEPRSFALAPKGPHSPRGPRATHEELSSVFAGLGLTPEQVRPLGALGPRGPRYHVLGPDELLVGRRFATLESELSDDGVFMLAVEGNPDDRRLAMWRNALWPLIHVNAVVRVRGGKAQKITLSGAESFEGSHEFEGALLVGQRTAHVMRPTSTVEKFDKNARSWNGESKGTGKRGANYPHFRWMRKFVGRFVRPAAPEGRAMEILDFGCGAGWVGIEAAKRVPGAVLSSFDPSPQMVEITGQNAAANGVTDFHGRTGFGEAPPFGGEVEDKRYDLVISSGVVSFSPDVEAWLDGLSATVRAGGDLVVGDIHPTSKGFMRRRRRKPLLPVREMNARAREEIRAGLEQRGFTHVKSGAYQLTRPIPEAMHVNERLPFGILAHPLLWLNRLATFLDGSFGSPVQDRFDSWVMHLRAPEADAQAGD